VPYYYLAYQLRRAGFTSVTAHYDRFKTSARLLLALWGPFVGIAHALFRRRLESKKPDVVAENAGFLRELNSMDMLTSRSVIAVASKQDDGPAGPGGRQMVGSPIDRVHNER
jgi:hypothetical protein